MPDGQRASVGLKPVWRETTSTIERSAPAGLMVLLLHAASRKAHKTIAESLELATAIKNAVGPLRDVEVAIAPVFTALSSVAKRLEGSAVALAAQNCFWEDQGAWTGEVSAKLLADVGCKYVIVGHSERRQHFGETGPTIVTLDHFSLRKHLLEVVSYRWEATPGIQEFKE